MNREDIVNLDVDQFVIKAFIPEGDGPFDVILLNHGWTGDENSMWIFGSQIFPDQIMIAPRALHLSNHPKYGGYSWVERTTEAFSTFDDFKPAVETVNQLISDLAEQLPQGDFSEFSVAGFSQGAALSYVYSLVYPERVKKLASLAGFMPKGVNAIVAAKPLRDLPVLIAHGTADEAVPIEQAYEAEELCTQAGALVQMCVSDVGHKLGGNCMRSFKEFMSR